MIEIIIGIMCTLTPIAIITMIICIISANKNKSQNINIENQNEIKNEKSEYLPYHKKLLLTKNEYYFYNNLKKITNEKNLQILAKIRLADLIEVNQGTNEWNKYFAKIKSKHIDFAIADNMKIIVIIELDDKSHEKQNRIERDEFVDAALTKTGYKIIRTLGNTEEIEKYINSIITAPEDTVGEKI